MATVLEVMAKLSGNSSGMVGAFRSASSAAEAYRDRTRAATRTAIGTPDINGKLRDASGRFMAQAEQVGKSGGKKLGDSFTEASSSGFKSGFKGIVAGAGVLAATVGFGALIREAGAASDATDKFKATMNFAGLDTSAIDRAGKAAKDFADQTVYDLPTIQKTIAQLASNGIQDYVGLTKAAGNLNAVAGGNAETFKSVGMVMAQTAGAGKLTSENWNQLADAIPGAAGPLMRALEDAGAYTGNFREAMEKGQITSDEFNSALMKLGNSPVAVEAAKSTATFEGAIGSLQATINSGLMGALNAIKPAATAALGGMATGLGVVFGAIGGVYSLLKTGDFTGAIGKALGVEEDSKIVDVLLTIREKTQSFFDGIKSGSGAMAPVMETVRQVFDSLRPVIDQLGPVLAGLLPSLMTLVTAFSPLSIAITALLPVLPILAAAAGTLAAALGVALAAALQVVAPILAGIVTGVAEAVTWFMSLQGGAEALSGFIITLVAGLGIYKGVIMAISAATKAWAVVQAILGAIMAVNPVTLIIIGIALLIAAIILLVQNWDNVVSFITQIWGGFINWITGVMNGFAGWLSGVWSNITSSISSFAATLFTPVVDAWNTVLAFFATVGAIIVGYVTGIANGVVAGWTAMVGFITGIFTAIGTFITGVWTWIFNLLTAIGTAFWAEHGAQLTAAWAFIVAIFTAIGAFIAAVWTAIGTAIAAAWAWITGVISGALTAAWEFIVAMFTAIWTFIVSIFTTIGEAVMTAWNFYVSIITTVLSAIWAVISSVFTTVWGFISGIFNTIAGFIGGVWNTIMGVISGAVNVIAGVINGWVSAAWSVISSTFNNVVGFLGGIWGSITGGVSSMVGQVGGFFSGMWGTITGALSGAGQWLWSAGVNIVEGLIGGVKSLAGTIGNAFLSMVPGWIVGPFKAALGIASPSKLFKTFGRNLLQGLGIGVNAEKGAAVKAMEGAAAAVSRAGSGITVTVPTLKVPKAPQLDTSRMNLEPITIGVRLDASAFESAARKLSLGDMRANLGGTGAAGVAGGYTQPATGLKSREALPQAQQVFNITNINPVAEPTSKTVEKAQDLAALGGII